MKEAPRLTEAPRYAGLFGRDEGTPDSFWTSLRECREDIQVIAEAILAALAKTGFNRTAAAKLLGLTFRTLRYRMQRLGIREPEQDDR